MDQKKIAMLAKAQKTELTASKIYSMIAAKEKNDNNSRILYKLSAQEAHHAEILKQYTGMNPTHNRFSVLKFKILTILAGITFTIKLMEKAEEASERFYSDCEEEDIKAIAQEESYHETQLICMINEERLEYIGSVVLGLNDALVEFTGALAGFTLALNNASLIALTGSITGIAAALSMASSEYLSTKSENDSGKHPVKAAVYTGLAYIVTVTALVTPFILLNNVLFALAIMLIMALLIIAIFNYYYSVARGESFKKRFLEMALLSFSVAGISFLIGYALKYFTGIEA